MNSKGITNIRTAVSIPLFLSLDDITVMLKPKQSLSNSQATVTIYPLNTQINWFPVPPSYVGPKLITDSEMTKAVY
jgi:hypothetical protein